MKLQDLQRYEPEGHYDDECQDQYYYGRMNEDSTGEYIELEEAQKVEDHLVRRIKELEQENYNLTYLAGHELGCNRKPDFRPIGSIEEKHTHDERCMPGLMNLRSTAELVRDVAVSELRSTRKENEKLKEQIKNAQNSLR